jgi:ferredoxin
MADFSPVDSLFNKIYTSRWSPLYQSGALALFFFVVVLVTGIYLLLFYNVADPYNSVQNICSQAYLGRWIRTLHRYSTDAALVAIAFHILKMFTSSRSWGPRARAWASGWVLMAGVVFCSWTGFLLIADRQAQWLALEGARILDALPIFTAPLPMLFSEGELPGSFFFSILFLHVAVPLGLIGLYLLHVSRVARPTHKAPYAIRLHSFLALLVVSVAWPVAMKPAADFSRLMGETTVDLFFTGLLPIVAKMPAWSVWVFGSGLLLFLALGIPMLTKPKEKLVPSWVDWESCTGCTTCYMDCPYEAIAMVTRVGKTAGDARRSELVAKVNPDLCVSCGICAGSCAPMGVGPAKRTGRDQLTAVREWFESHSPVGDMVLIACEASFPGFDLGTVYPVSCGGSVHTSVIEYLIRRGVSGVYLLTCPARDCRNREGPKWAHERIYNDREAELQARVDRNRVRTGAFAGTEMAQAILDIQDFAQKLEALAKDNVEAAPVIEPICPEKVLSD